MPNAALSYRPSVLLLEARRLSDSHTISSVRRPTEWHKSSAPKTNQTEERVRITAEKVLWRGMHFFFFFLFFFKVFYQNPTGREAIE